MLQADAPPGCSRPSWRPAPTSSTSCTRPQAWSPRSSRSASPTRSIRLRAHAFANDRPLTEMAADIVARRLRFDPEEEP